MYEERPRGVAFFSLKKRRLRGVLTALLSSLREALEEMEADSSQRHVLLGREAMGTGDIGKCIFTTRVVKPWGMFTGLLSRRPIHRGAQKW